MLVRAILLAAMLMMVPLGARAADLVVWWRRGSILRRPRRSRR
jgi:hypothetical protein